LIPAQAGQAETNFQSQGNPTALRVARRRHVGRWIAVAFIAVGIAMAIHLIVTNPNFQWAVVAKYIVAAPVLDGVLNTLKLTVVAMLVGVFLGVLIAIGRLSPDPFLSKLAFFYAWLFRAVPLLVQLLFWYYLAALVTRISIGIPFGPSFYSVSTNSAITPFFAAILGLGLNEAAYMSEIIRSGLLAVPKGQVDAASALGMTPGQVLRKVTLGQAMRVIIPPSGNETISCLKSTSLVLVVGYAELLTTVSRIYAVTYQTIPLLTVAALWYLAMTGVLGYCQSRLERHYGRGYSEGAKQRRSKLLVAPTRLARISRNSTQTPEYVG
jgi:polar amino acid transport system permease protein